LVRPKGFIGPWRRVSAPRSAITNALGTLYNMVGFQTKLRHAEQVRVFRTIPGLENAETLRLGLEPQGRVEEARAVEVGVAVQAAEPGELGMSRPTPSSSCARTTRSARSTTWLASRRSCAMPSKSSQPVIWPAKRRRGSALSRRVASRRRGLSR
jgi:hypothetical protein